MTRINNPLYRNDAHKQTTQADTQHHTKNHEIATELQAWVEAATLQSKHGHQTRVDYEDAANRILACWQAQETNPNSALATSLSLDHRAITSLPACITQLPQLQELNVRFCKLNSLPKNIGQLTQLRKLTMSACGLQSLPESFKQLIKLQELDISWNQLLFSSPENIRLLSELTELRKLKASNCNLHFFPEKLSQLTQLRELDLSHNQLPAIHEKIGQLNQLRKFNVSGNKLSFFPESIAQLTQLQKFNFSYNNLTFLRESIGQLTELRELDISYNKDLRFLPETIGKLKKIRKLNCQNNSAMNTIPQVIRNLPLLSRLNLIGTPMANQWRRLTESAAHGRARLSAHTDQESPAPRPSTVELRNYLQKELNARKVSNTMGITGRNLPPEASSIIREFYGQSNENIGLGNSEFQQARIFVLELLDKLKSEGTLT